jgi:hypothetical protein
VAHVSSRLVEKQGRASRRVAIIVAQQPTQALSSLDLAAVAPHARLWGNELIAETLVIALAVRMRQILSEHRVERSFAQQEPLAQRLLLDRANEPFAVRVQVWAPRWEADRLHPAGFAQRIECQGNRYVARS